MRIGILTGGEDAPALNAAVRGVTKHATSTLKADVMGLLDGYEGLIGNHLRRLDLDDVSGIVAQGGTILGSTMGRVPASFNA